MDQQTKKNKLKYMGKIFSIMFSIITIMLTLTLADFFSSLITVGGFTFTSSDISVPKYTIYAISTASVQTNKLAIEESTICKNQGGAGYIYMCDNAYHIIASMYENQSDAEKVVAGLKESQISANIIEITMQSISFNSNLESQEKTTLEGAINSFKTSYKKLYDISISLDTGVKTEVNARLSLNELANEIKTKTDNFNTLFSAQTTSSFIALKLKLNDLCTALTALVNPSTNYPLTAHIKDAYCQSIFLYKSLTESLG